MPGLSPAHLLPSVTVPGTHRLAANCRDTASPNSRLTETTGCLDSPCLPRTQRSHHRTQDPAPTIRGLAPTPGPGLTHQPGGQPGISHWTPLAPELQICGLTPSVNPLQAATSDPPSSAHQGTSTSPVSPGYSHLITWAYHQCSQHPQRPSLAINWTRDHQCQLDHS